MKGLLLCFLAVMTLAGCSSTPTTSTQQVQASVVCDTYIILNMCVEDLAGDGTVDMVYFSDTNEAFMYQQGMHDAVAQVMPLHRCAVPLNAGMQTTTNRILGREDLSLSEELDITRQLIANYIAAKPTIDACNARFEENNPGPIAQEDEFFIDESDWDIE